MRIFVDDKEGTVSVEWHSRSPLSVLRDDDTVTVRYSPPTHAPTWDSSFGITEDYELGRAEGYDEGFDEGYSKGHTEGHMEGYKEGRADERETPSPGAVA